MFIIPFTRLIVGSSIGSTAAVVPLVVASTPFIARLLESSFSEVDKGVILAAKAMGATNFQIVTKVILPESLPSILRGMSIATITIVGYVAMAGVVGAGGLGDVGIRYGFHRYQSDVMIATIVLLIALVQIIQILFGFFAKKFDKNK